MLKDKRNSSRILNIEIRFVVAIIYEGKIYLHFGLNIVVVFYPEYNSEHGYGTP